MPPRGTGPAVIHGRRSTDAEVVTAEVDGVVELEFWVELFRGLKQSLTVLSGWILH